MPRARARTAALTGFQSAPAITGGRCLSDTLLMRPYKLVSIRARHYWRAMPAGEIAPAVVERVSIRARHYWRAMQGAGVPGRAVGRVSIRARHYWRAMQALSTGTKAFTSVSIRARHYWRAMPQLTWIPYPICCFNPRPPLLAGDAIRACGLKKPTPCFNPRPPLLAGDAHKTEITARGAECFNPRPPLLAGDAARGSYVHTLCEVSIRARHYWRAMLCLLACRPQCRQVSIRARHYWRAMRLLPVALVTVSVFQSAPAITGGRCSSA